MIWRERPPRPAPANAPVTEFSATRAWPVLAHLADTIGYRVAGTPGADSAVAYLVRTLRGIPGLDVTVQDASGAWRYPRSPGVLAYTVRNVLVRIPGRDSAALLLSAHYDTPVGSKGAADDGVAVAALVEIARAVAAGPPLAHTVILNINDGEEQGLVGSHAFTRHPWAHDVRAFVNLESAGPHGKAILFQAGPGNEWLTRAYAAAVPYPYGTVVAQDIFQSGVLPSDTDFRDYRDVGLWRGLDIALYQGGWAYHTQRDRTWNVTPGTLQHMGANALALTRALASGALPGNVSSDRAVYYDVLGAFMLSYSAHAANWLAAAALLFGFVVLIVCVVRGRVHLREVAAAFACVVASIAAAMVAALLLAVVMAYVLRRPMSWFAHPAPGILAFAFVALAGALAGQLPLVSWMRRRGLIPAIAGRSVQCAALIAWTLVLAAFTGLGLGSAYLPVWWVVGGAAGLGLGLLLRDDRWWVGVLVGALPAGVLTLQLLVTLTRLFVPVFGRLPMAIAPDLVLAVIVAIPVAAIALAVLPGAHRAGALRAATLVLTLIALSAATVSVTRARYTYLRPQRLRIVHQQSDSTSDLRVFGEDYDTPKSALAAAPGMVAMDGTTARPLDFQRRAGPTGFAAPTLELLSSTTDSAAGTRTLALRASAPGAYRLHLLLPRARLVGWSVPAALPPLPGNGDGRIGVTYIAPPDTGWRFTLRVRGDTPLPIELQASRAVVTADAAALERQLPPWTD
ncbi:MAG: M28 family peptidase, partial [Gemmatimonadaceae bacterium]